MKILPLLLFALGLSTGLRADDDDLPRDPKPAGAEEKTLQDPKLANALKRLEERLGIKFTIPFPKNFDVDAHKRLPLAVLAVDGGKVCITRPMLNPFDEPRTVEWMMGPEDPDKLGNVAIDCAFALDEHGELERVRLIVDWAADRSNHQLERGENESGKDFLERARLTYRDRAGKAEDPVMARRYVEAWEKVVVAVMGAEMREGRSVE